MALVIVAWMVVGGEVRSRHRGIAPRVVRCESAWVLRAVQMTLSPDVRAARARAEPKPLEQPVMSQVLGVGGTAVVVEVDIVRLVVWKKRVKWRKVEVDCLFRRAE